MSFLREMLESVVDRGALTPERGGMDPVLGTEVDVGADWQVTTRRERGLKCSRSLPGDAGGYKGDRQ